MAVSNKRALETTVRKSDILAETTPGGDLRRVSMDTKTIDTAIKEETYETKIEFGTIHQVLALSDKIMVSVAEIDPDHSDGDEPDENGHSHSSLFNTFGRPAEVTSLLQIMIPLVNFNQDFQQVSLNDLVGKKVKVNTIDGFYAIDAELITTTSFDFIHDSEIFLMDLFTASNLNVDPLSFLNYLGYSEEQLDDFYKLSVDKYPTKGVLRFEDEAYWDKDVNKVDDTDVFIPQDEVPANLIGRNFLKMKTQLCHMPVIMFSGK